MTCSWGDPDWDEKTKHTFFAIRCFNFWGKKVGRIGGQVKEKWGEPRWYASLRGFRCLYDVTHPNYAGYWWSPERGKKEFMLDFINNVSRFYFNNYIVIKLSIWYQILFYNIAYWIAMLRYPSLAHDVYSNADWPELIFMGSKFAHCKWWCELKFPENREDIEGDKATEDD